VCGHTNSSGSSGCAAAPLTASLPYRLTPFPPLSLTASLPYRLSPLGWSLGENGEWRKFHLSELGTRVPMVIAVPWLPRTHGLHANGAMCELVDVVSTVSHTLSHTLGLN
jgi:hypothetical protein